MIFPAFFSALLLIVGQSFLYHPSDPESKINFQIKNFGVAVDGSFAGLKGSIEVNPSEPEHANIVLSVDATTIDTGIALRNNHLKKEEYLDVSHYPRLSFVSSKITKQEGTWMANGTLTIKDTKKEIHFLFTTKKQSEELLFEGEFTINRRDFKVGGNSFSLADELIVHFKILARSSG